MSGPVIIRLQNLPLEARSIDIRRFFEGLQIPDGGVHIIGGEKGDAFIAFQSDEDARLAMARDNMPLCNARIRLFLSSKTEMQNVITAARNQQMAAAAAATTAVAPRTSTLPSSIEQILFKSAQPVVTPRPPVSVAQSDMLSNLSNLTKLFSGPASAAAASPVVTSAVQETAKPAQTVDHLKSLASILPIITQQKQSNPAAPAASVTTNLLSSQLTAQQTSQSNGSGAPKFNINQIFDMLATHFKTTPSDNSTNSSGVGITAAAVTTTTASTPSNGDYQTSNKYDYQYRQPPPSLGSSYRQQHTNDSALPPIKYASSNGSGAVSSQFSTPPPPLPPSSSSLSLSTTTGAAITTTTTAPPTGAPAQKLDPIIRVKNFAPVAGYKEIRTFLQGVQIEHDGIKLLYDGNGQRTGQAFVRLIGIIDLKKALCRNKQFYEDRQIEVMQSNEHEFATTNVVVEYPAMQRHKNRQQQETSSSSSNDWSGSGSKRPSAPPPASGTSYNQQDQEQDNGGPPSGFYLKIYGLPISFDDQQLKAMFNNVKFVRISTAKPTPINTKVVNADGSMENTTIVKAKKLCQVETQLDLERALTRQDERVGKSKVQIFQITKSEYDRELSYIPGAYPSGGSTTRRPPPYYQQSNNGNSYHHANGGSTGDSDENQPPEYMDMGGDGGGGGENRDEDARYDTNGGGAGVSSSMDDESYIYMHGVPFSAREAEVKSFFPSYAQPRVVHFLLDADTFKPTGECCCEFGSRVDRERALQKDGQLLRNRVIKIRPINVAEYRQHVAALEELRERQPKRGPRQPLLYTPMAANEKPRLYSETLINLMKSRPASNPVGVSSLKRPAVSSSSSLTYSSSHHKRIRSSPEPSSSSPPQQQQQQSSSSPPPPGIVELPPLPPELQQHKKSIVLLSHVSFEATREDILELFRPYSPIEQTLKIRHDDQGQPTGDAIVACRSAELAVKACARLNGTNFMGRHIRAVMLEP